jgi:SagB-type dehydrogenase family enzyme
MQFLYSARNSPFSMVEDSARVLQQRKTDDAQRDDPRTHKSYRSAELIPLVSTVNTVKADFVETVMARRANRSLRGDQWVRLQSFSNCLRIAYSSRRGVEGLPQSRTAPSGGRRYPLELYVVVQRVEGVPAGIYHYNSESFGLARLESSKNEIDLMACFPAERTIVGNAAAVILITSVMKRTVQRYGARGWKIALLDAGHLGQNIWLAATAVGLGCTALAGGVDASISRLLQTDETQEPFLLAYGVGVTATTCASGETADK